VDRRVEVSVGGVELEHPLAVDVDRFDLRGQPLFIVDPLPNA
jgi:hypothetical protein